MRLSPPLLCVEPRLGRRSRSNRGWGVSLGEARRGNRGWWHQSETEGVRSEDWCSVVWDCCWCKVWSVCHFDSLSTVFAPVRGLTCCWDLACSEVRSGRDRLVSCRAELASLAAGNTADVYCYIQDQNVGITPHGCQGVHMQIPLFPLRVTLLSAAQPPLCTWKDVVQFKCKFPHGRRVTIWVT